MKKNSRNIMALLLGAVLLLATACASPGPTQVATSQTPEPTDPPQQEVPIIGEIIAFNQDMITLLTGDIAKDYTLPKEALEKFHLGEIVSITKADSDSPTVAPYMIEDFSVRFTGMGQRIETTSGKIIAIETANGESLIKVLLNTEKDEKQFIYYGTELPLLNETYILELAQFGVDKTIIADFFDPKKIVKMTVDEIKRSDIGELIFLASDQAGGTYQIGTFQKTLNFNLSELKVGDTLEVYADAVMESLPMQVKSRKIDKVQ